MSKEELYQAMENDHAEAQMNSSCQCFSCPPCSFCVNGFSLSIGEFKELYYDQYSEEHSVTIDDKKPDFNILDLGRGLVK